MKTSHTLFELYESVKLTQIVSRRLNQSQMLAWLQPFMESGTVTSSKAGLSAEGRTISLLSYGSGPIKVLLWSQMHGDEPTATMALMDILNFFARIPEHPIASAIRKGLTLLILPMLNPDGAERFQRRTAQNIDMNRDALKLQTPEARVLKSICEREKPLFGFNLHDQDPRNTVGQTTKAAAIALLAPAEKESGPDSESRKRAKHLAAFLVEALKPHIPDNLARYDDTFESRAFGDNVQKWGTSTVLIESGGWANDREKMFLRKLNFVAILCSLNAILSGEYEKTDVRSYEQLPLNGKNLYDLIFHNVRFQPSNNLQPVFIDVGINFDEQKDPSSGRMVLIGKIVDLGDLSTFGAFEEKHCDGRPFGPDVLAIDKSMTREEWLFILGGS